MTIAVHALAVDTFVPMLESLAAILDTGAAHARRTGRDLVQARLASDMYTLAQQVQEACFYARDGMARLAGQSPAVREDAATTFTSLKAQIARTLDAVRAIPAAAFAGAQDRDCSLEIPGDREIVMNGERFLTAWLLPHFYFHVVTAYDILRHNGVAVGKQDYLSQVGGFIRAKTA